MEVVIHYQITTHDRDERSGKLEKTQNCHETLKNHQLVTCASYREM